MLLKAVRSAAPWSRLLWLTACLRSVFFNHSAFFNHSVFFNHSALLTTASPSLLAGPSTAAFSVTVAVAFALVAAVALAGRARLDAACSSDPRPRRVAVRARIERTAFLPQRDPDAAGRRRPRAPGH